jgi:hypothetical protein
MSCDNVPSVKIFDSNGDPFVIRHKLDSVEYYQPAVLSNDFTGHRDNKTFLNTDRFQIDPSIFLVSTRTCLGEFSFRHVIDPVDFDCLVDVDFYSDGINVSASAQYNARVDVVLERSINFSQFILVKRLRSPNSVFTLDLCDRHLQFLNEGVGLVVDWRFCFYPSDPNIPMNVSVDQAFVYVTSVVRNSQSSI